MALCPSTPPEASLLLDSAWWPFQDSTRAWDEETRPIVSLSAPAIWSSDSRANPEYAQAEITSGAQALLTPGQGDTTWCYISSETPSHLREERVRLWVSVYPSLILVSSSTKWT